MPQTDTLEPSRKEQSSTLQYATFRVAEMFMGIELSRVQELMRHQEMAYVPLAPAAVRGLINLRGQIVTALDMRTIFSLPPLTSGDAQSMNIVIRSDGGPVSLLVDEICDVLEVPEEAWTSVPENLAPAQRSLLQGVYQLDSTLLLVVDAERVLTLGAN